jgi:hypothetical protein
VHGARQRVWCPSNRGEVKLSSKGDDRSVGNVLSIDG